MKTRADYMKSSNASSPRPDSEHTIEIRGDSVRVWTARSGQLWQYRFACLPETLTHAGRRGSRVRDCHTEANRMPMFSVQRRIPLCLGTRDLVEALENYILRRAREVTEADGKQIDPTNFAVEIVESAGTGHLSSITQFEGTRFFNGTKRIDVAYSRYARRLKIQDQLDPGRFDSFRNVNTPGYHQERLSLV